MTGETPLRQTAGVPNSKSLKQGTEATPGGNFQRKNQLAADTTIKPAGETSAEPTCGALLNSGGRVLGSAGHSVHRYHLLFLTAGVSVLWGEQGQPPPVQLVFRVPCFYSWAVCSFPFSLRELEDQPNPGQGSLGDTWHKRVWIGEGNPTFRASLSVSSNNTACDNLPTCITNVHDKRWRRIHLHSSPIVQKKMSVCTHMRTQILGESQG